MSIYASSDTRPKMQYGHVRSLLVIGGGRIVSSMAMIKITHEDELLVVRENLPSEISLYSVIDILIWFRSSY